MEKNNGKIIAIVALIVAVVALSVGFAAFADQLTIDGNATVKQGANAFDDQTNGLAYLSSSPACVITNTQTSVATSPYSQGTASGDTWSGISVPLTTDNPSVTCTATVENRTAYTAYLRGITTNSGIHSLDERKYSFNLSYLWNNDNYWNYCCRYESRSNA